MGGIFYPVGCDILIVASRFIACLSCLVAMPVVVGMACRFFKITRKDVINTSLWSIATLITGARRWHEFSLVRYRLFIFNALTHF